MQGSQVANKFLGALYRKGNVYTVHEGEGPRFPSVLLAKGCVYSLSQALVVKVLLCHLPQREPTDHSLYPTH